MIVLDNITRKKCCSTRVLCVISYVCCMRGEPLFYANTEYQRRYQLFIHINGLDLISVRTLLSSRFRIIYFQITSHILRCLKI